MARTFLVTAIAGCCALGLSILTGLYSVVLMFTGLFGGGISLAGFALGILVATVIAGILRAIFYYGFIPFSEKHGSKLLEVMGYVMIVVTLFLLCEGYRR
jgi:antibiotic biosynthesis monooxygenase (ABM) superfamily enzyme